MPLRVAILGRPQGLELKKTCPFIKSIFSSKESIVHLRSFEILKTFHHDLQNR